MRPAEVAGRGNQCDGRDSDQSFFASTAAGFSVCRSTKGEGRGSSDISGRFAGCGFSGFLKERFRDRRIRRSLLDFRNLWFQGRSGSACCSASRGRTYHGRPGFYGRGRSNRLLRYRRSQRRAIQRRWGGWGRRRNGLFCDRGCGSGLLNGRSRLGLRRG